MVIRYFFTFYMRLAQVRNDFLTIIIEHLLSHSKRGVVKERDVPAMVVVLRIMHDDIVFRAGDVNSALLVRYAGVIFVVLKYLRFVEAWELLKTLRTATGRNKNVSSQEEEKTQRFFKDLRKHKSQVILRFTMIPNYRSFNVFKISAEQIK